VKHKRKTEIRLQLNEVVSFKTERVWATWCAECHQRRRMIPADDAALAAKQSAREIYRLVEAGLLHYREDANGLLYVCFASLQRLAGNQDGQTNQEV
jgi:hypothetical protein